MIVIGQELQTAHSTLVPQNVGIGHNRPTPSAEDNHDLTVWKNEGGAQQKADQLGSSV